jgi:hypothetical protein
MVDGLAVTRCSGVVKLIDDHVVELVFIEDVEMVLEGLDRGEHDIGVWLTGRPEKHPELRSGTHSAEDFKALTQDLLAMSDEERPPELWAGGIEGGEPRLAQASCHDHQTCSMTGQAGVLKGFKRFFLNLSWRNGLNRGLDYDSRCRD